MSATLCNGRAPNCEMDRVGWQSSLTAVGPCPGVSGTSGATPLEGFAGVPGLGSVRDVGHVASPWPLQTLQFRQWVWERWCITLDSSEDATFCVTSESGRVRILPGLDFLHTSKLQPGAAPLDSGPFFVYSWVGCGIRGLPLPVGDLRNLTSIGTPGLLNELKFISFVCVV